MYTGTRHFGVLRFEVPRKPRTITDWSCSICRRYGTPWANDWANTLHVRGRKRHGYSWGGKALRFVRCAVCGCVSHWERVHPREDSYVGVNSRIFAPGMLDPSIPLRGTTPRNATHRARYRLGAGRSSRTPGVAARRSRCTG